MKISYSNYPALKLLNQDNLKNIIYCKEDEIAFLKMVHIIERNFLKYKTVFKNNVYVIQKPFFEAIETNKIKLIELGRDIIDNNIADIIINGTYIMPYIVLMVDIKILKDDPDAEYNIHLFDKNGALLGFYSGKNHVDCFISTEVRNKEQIITRDNIDEFFHGKLGGLILLIHLFKTYAEVETKHLKGNQKLKDIDCKYINDTKLDIKYLNSKWFTNLVKSDSFNVRGHFRLQAYGEGLKKRRLIWIEDFQKSGYTAKAKILS